MKLFQNDSQDDNTIKSPSSHVQSTEEQPLEQQQDYFWEQLQKTLKCQFPKYVLNLMKFCGFDTPIAIQQITVEDIELMENFARNDMRELLNRRANLADYFGIYSQKPNQFKILPGHVKLIFGIRDYLSSNNWDFSSDVSIANKTSSQRAFWPRCCHSKRKEADAPLHKMYESGTGEKNRILKTIRTWIENSLSRSKTLHSSIHSDIDADDNSRDNLTLDLTIEQLHQLNKIVIDDVALAGNNAKVRCTLCDNPNYISIVNSSLKSGSRWIISNFIRHAKMHIVRKNHGKNRGKNSQIDDQIIYSDHETSVKSAEKSKKQISILQHVVIRPSSSSSLNPSSLSSTENETDTMTSNIDARIDENIDQHLQDESAESNKTIDLTKIFKGSRVEKGNENLTKDNSDDKPLINLKDKISGEDKPASN